MCRNCCLSLISVGRDVVDAMVIMYGQISEPWLAGSKINYSGTYFAYCKIIATNIDSHAPV
jgi:hypothetical protein